MKIVVKKGAGDAAASLPGTIETQMRPDVKKLAIILTRGAYNNLLQGCELARVAAESGVQVSLFFRDEAVARLTVDKVQDIVLSDAFKGRESRIRDLLHEEKQDDLRALLRQVKEQGDAKFSICQRSLRLFDVRTEKIIPEVDEVQTLESFWKEEVLSADQVLTF